MDPNGCTTLFLCGDVMTGRGIDQILPHPCDPVLHESCVRDAREYVRLAQCASGLIAAPVPWEYIWGDALDELRRSRPDLRIVNLETSVTRSNVPWSGKGVHYRMHPSNIACIIAADINCCCLANNHVLDWGRDGLIETLRSLDDAGLAHAGAGANAVTASAPAMLDLPDNRRVLVFCMASETSGVPDDWAATGNRGGVSLLSDLSESAAADVTRAVGNIRRAGDVVIASIHWGGNWGYDIPDEQIAFAHALVDGGVDVVHGHSSHHLKAIEVYRDRPILYGCGDFINDYEGIGGYEEFRPDLRLMHFVELASADHRLVAVRLVPMRVARMRLNRCSSDDARWLGNLLNELGVQLRTAARVGNDSSLSVQW